MNAITLYTPPQRALVVIPRKADPLPQAVPLINAVSRFRFDVGQEVVAIQAVYSLERAFQGLPYEVYEFKRAKIVRREQRPDGLWYTVNYETQVGARTTSFSTFPVMKREADLGVSFHEVYTRQMFGQPNRAVHSAAARRTMIEYVKGTRGGVSLAA